MALIFIIKKAVVIWPTKKKSIKIIVKIMISTLIPDMQDRQNFPLHKG